MEGAGGAHAGRLLPSWGQQRAASGCLGGNSQRRVEIRGRFVWGHGVQQRRLQSLLPGGRNSSKQECPWATALAPLAELTGLC